MKYQTTPDYIYIYYDTTVKNMLNKTKIHIANHSQLLDVQEIIFIHFTYFI